MNEVFGTPSVRADEAVIQIREIKCVSFQNDQASAKPFPFLLHYNDFVLTNPGGGGGGIFYMAMKWAQMLS